MIFLFRVPIMSLKRDGACPQIKRLPRSIQQEGQPYQKGPWCLLTAEYDTLWIFGMIWIILDTLYKFKIYLHYVVHLGSLDDHLKLYGPRSGTDVWWPGPASRLFWRSSWGLMGRSDGLHQIRQQHPSTSQRQECDYV